MGCGVGLFSPYTQQDIEIEIANFTPRLPMAELMNGGIIKLPGANGFFNPNSLLDPSWLRGKMTVEEYQQAIMYINRCTGYSHVGLSKMYSTTERAMRLNLKIQAGMQAVAEINQRHRDVHFTYQMTAQDMRMDASYNLDPTQQFMQGGRQPVGHSTLSILYITIH